MGFEPTVPAKAQRFSRPPRSTTLAPLRSAVRPEPPTQARVIVGAQHRVQGGQHTTAQGRGPASPVRGRSVGVRRPRRRSPDARCLKLGWGGQNSAKPDIGSVLNRLMAVRQQARLGSAQTRQGGSPPGPALLKQGIPKACLWRSLRQSLNLACFLTRLACADTGQADPLPRAARR